MSDHVSRRRSPASLALTLGACALLAACGGSSSTSKTASVLSSSATTTAAAASSSGATGKAHGSGATGSTTSQSATSSGAGHSESRAATTATTASESSQAQNENPAAKNLKGPLKNAITTFIGCMGEHGIKLPKPNFSGKASEVLSSKGVDTHSPQFESAINACGTDLIAVLRAGGASIGGSGASPKG